MGAFGELLIKNWGGDLDAYRGTKQQVKPAKKEKIEKVSPYIKHLIEKQEREERYKPQILNKARQYLKSLTNNLIYQPKLIVNYTEESIKGGFKELGFDEEVQNIMWGEFSEFSSKYLNKTK